MTRFLLFIFLFIPLYIFSQNKISYKVYYDENLEQNGLKIQVDYIQKILLFLNHRKRQTSITVMNS
ncbi:hypothetical protein DRF60_02635 [Chryseobacterium elymi]|uniref:Uncharacterized protein n=1 Tax=Chryseobacterium elymi TaxID=395936 RepID=A0A3D9DPJ2_9FLAO|nr:hypothetical protein DRF60_02635 [Chryseobacterium elymi]